jgi:hypothetical protein
MARGCYGCFGPRESANGESLASWFSGPLELPDERIAAKFAGFTGYAPALRSVIDARGGPPGMRAGSVAEADLVDPDGGAA